MMYHALVDDLKNVICPETIASKSSARVTSPLVELSFKAYGKVIPIDHSYGLYSAISHQFSQLHEVAQGVSIQNINGLIDASQRVIHINETSQLKIRTLTDRISQIYPLANQQFQIGKHSIRLVGFGLEILNLSDKDSLILQNFGLGGKRKMGCGIFVPTLRSIYDSGNQTSASR